jgi:hypothetical protein
LEQANWTISLFRTEIDHFDLSRASLKEAGSFIIPLEESILMQIDIEKFLASERIFLNNLDLISKPFFSQLLSCATGVHV